MITPWKAKGLPASALLQASRPVSSMQPTPGFSEQVDTMDLSGPHTIQDAPEYMEQNLGPETLQWVKEGRSLTIAVGEGQKTLERLKESGWKLGEPVDKEVGFHQVRHARDPEGKSQLLIWRVNGDDRVEHMQSFLKLAGARSEQVQTVGATHSFKDDYLRTFQRLGDKAPDLVVYGMSKTSAFALLSDHPIRNAGHLWDLFSRRGAPVVGETEKSSDMAGLKMEVMKLQNGQSVWFLPPLYGDLSRDLLDALLEHGVKKLNFVGTCGGVDPNLKVRQVTTPHTWVHDNGERESLDWLTPHSGHDLQVSYGRVSTPNVETQRWAQDMDARDVDVIEVELGHWFKVLEDRPDVEFRVQTVVSDVIQGPNHRDMTRWGFRDNFATMGPVKAAMEEALGADEGRDTLVKDFFSVPLVQPLA
ncbi:MAG: hypothetical protein KC800_17035 [Candidatus Eremiobacteraeota bacterium]|nr:hypothetical protein [Candidatus Eremiobacteraeota bacterium]